MMLFLPRAVVRSAFALLILSFTPFVWGEDAPWVSSRFAAPAEAYQKVAALSEAPAGADVEVLYDETSVSIDANRRWTLQYYVVFRVLTPRGASQWDSLSASWAPWHQDMPTLEARVFGANGGVHVLAPETIKESSPSSDSDKVYSDRRRLEAPLPAIAVGSIVEERTTIRDTQPYFDAGTMERFTFGNYSPTRQTRLVVDAPANLPLRHTLTLLPDAKVTKTVTGGRTSLVVDQGFLPAYTDYERYLPSDVPRFAAVSLSTATDWHSVASAYADVVAKQLGPKGAPLVPALDLKGSRNEKMDAVVRWVAKEIRYTGIEFGSSALVPHTPQETLARKYGDCKDKALLVVALLRDAGIPAELALLSAGPGFDTDADLPGMGYFDHAIVHVPGTPEAWIDPTDEFSRFGQVPSSDQGRLTLLANNATKALTKIPVAPASDNLMLETREVTMSAFGQGSVRETTQSFGALETKYRDFFAYKNATARKDWAVSYADDEYRTKAVDSIVVTDPADLSVPFQWTTQIASTPRATTSLSLATLWVRYEHVFERLPEWLRTAPDDDHPKERKGALLLPQPFVTEIRVKIVPPEGFVATQTPSSTTLHLGPAQLQETFTLAADGTVSAVLRFDTMKTVYSAEEALALRSSILDLVGQDPLEFRFEPQTVVLTTQGKFREAVDRGRQLAAAHPGSEHALRYAQALAALGLIRAAESEALKATEKSPDSALAWRVLGEIRESDDVGRDLRPGTNWEGARQALLQASSLSPGDQDVAGNVAILHEYDKDGVRYGSGAPLAKAISLYQAQGTAGRKEAGLETNLAYALFYQGRFAEAAAEANQLASPPLAVLVGSEAMVKSPEAAVSLAAKRTSNASTRSDALRTAGNMLMNLRHYPQATALLRAGATGANATQSNALATLLSKVKPAGDLEADHDGPASAVRRLVGFIVRDQAVTESSRALFSAAARECLSTVPNSELTKALGTMVNALRSSGLFRETLSDLILQMMQFRIEGTDDTGYRVRVTMPGAPTSSFFVVKEDSDFRIADLISGPGWSGSDLLSKIAAGRTDAVKQILDWFKEEMPPGSADEPVAVSPFLRYWKRAASSDPATLKRAVYLAMAGNKEAARAGTAGLAALLPTLPQGPDRVEVEDALVTGYLSQDRCAEAVPLAQAALERYPESRLSFSAAVQALTGAGRGAEVEALIARWLKARPGDLQGLRLKAASLEALGHHEEAVPVWQTVMATGQSVAGDWNSAAWNLLYFPGKEKEALELGLQALQSNQDNGAILHTVACLFAVNGRAAEAKEALIKSMDAEGVSALNDDYRLAQGLLAESVGLVDVARELYQAVNPPTKASETEQSSYRLAQNHLKNLPAKAP